MIFLNDIANTFRIAASNSDTFDHLLAQVYQTATEDTPLINKAYYPKLINGYWYVLGLKEVIKAVMELNNLTTMWLKMEVVRCDSDDEVLDDTPYQTVTAEILYAGAKILMAVDVSAGTWINLNLLTSSNVVCVFPGQTQYFSFFRAANTETCTITNKSADGTEVVTTPTISAGFNSLSVAYNADYAVTTVHLDRGNGVHRYFTVFHIHSAAAIEYFRFRNVFNLLEYVSIPAILEESPSTEFETAQMEDLEVAYDIEHKLECTVKASMLPVEMYKQLYALTHSRSVEYLRRYDDSHSKWHGVNITKYKLDRSTKDNTPTSIEMTFMYQDRKMAGAADLV